MVTTILPASESQKSSIAEMLQRYAIDLLAYIDIPQNEQGQFEYPELDNYWQEPEDHFPFLISSDGQIVGFIFVNRCFNLVDHTAWSIEEFYIAPEHRRKGIGFQAACQALLHFPGRWEVAVIASNKPALAFWDAVIRHTADGEAILHDWTGHDLFFRVFTFTISSTHNPLAPEN